MTVQRWGWYSVGRSGLLAVLHAIVAAASGSLAVAAELVHNFVDLAAAVAVLAGIKLASRKPKDFPYGLYKLENLAALGLAQRVLANPHRAPEKAKGIRVAEWLGAQKVDVVVLQEDVRGKGPEYVFRDAGVELCRTDRTALADVLAISEGSSDRC